MLLKRRFTIQSGLTLALLAAGFAGASSASAETFTSLPASDPAFISAPKMTFSFGPNYSTFSLINATVSYSDPANVNGDLNDPGYLTLTGSGLVAGSTYTYASTHLMFTPRFGYGGFPFEQDGTADVTITANSLHFSSAGSAFTGGNHSGSDLNVTIAAVPEASTLASLGLLLILGGLAVVVRKKRASAAV